MNRLSSLSTESFASLACRTWYAIDALMRRSTEGGLQYGWDLPTFGVLFPRKRAIWGKFLAEARRRGLSNVKVPMLPNPFRANGYRIVQPLAAAC